MSKKIKAVKAVLMWGNFYKNGKKTEIIVHPDEMNARVTALSCGESKPVAVIPIDNIPALVEQLRIAIGFAQQRAIGPTDRPFERHAAAVLESLGIPAGKRSAKK